jgi:hypothetical protein
MGVAAVYTPKSFDLTAIMADLVRTAEAAHAPGATPPSRTRSTA